MPERIQLSRRRGWVMPAGTVKVDRSTAWGNPFKADEPPAFLPLAECLEKFEELALTWDLTTLRGKNLACWCELNAPCHADILLRLANPAAFPADVLTADPSAYYRAGLRDLLSAAILHALHQAGNTGLTVEVLRHSIRAEHATMLDAFRRLTAAGFASTPQRQTGRGRPYSWTITPAGSALVTTRPARLTNFQPLLVPIP